MFYMVDIGDVIVLDSYEIIIFWRGDCDYFVVFFVEEVLDEDDEIKLIKRRVFRVFFCEG